MYELPKYQELDINSLSRMLDPKMTVASYKLYWFYGILDEIKLGNTEISFKTLIERMICKAWYSVLEFKLNLGLQDNLGKAIHYLHEEYNIEKNISEKDLKKVIEKIDSDEYFKIIKDFANLVPYRLISPFYTIKCKDSEKNKEIARLSQLDEKAIYKITGNNISNGEIKVNPTWYEYLSKNQVIVEGWVKFKLINYLQKKNPNVPSIVFKLEAPKARNLNAATKYWKGLIERYEVVDIYTKKPLKDDISIDHFIPWSFVLHDELWNLIPTTRSVNSIKSDKLPNLEEHLEGFLELLYFAFDTSIEDKKVKVLEDFLNINGLKLEKMEKEEFKTSIRRSIEPLYQLAENQGFQVWV